MCEAEVLGGLLTCPSGLLGRDRGHQLVAALIASVPWPFLCVHIAIVKLGMELKQYLGGGERYCFLLELSYCNCGWDLWRAFFFPIVIDQEIAVSSVTYS